MLCRRSIFVLLLFCVFAPLVVCQTPAPSWTKQVGARRAPAGKRVFLANKYGARPDGATDSTAALQRAIDECAKAGGGVVALDKGRYVAGAIFLKSNVHLRLDAGVTLLGSHHESAYPKLPTRVAGIEMEWPAALINVYGQKNVKISGGGVIDGRGEKWWQKYWDLRREYEPKGLRWASDYDAERVRLMVVWKSEDVTVENLNLRRAGFWTVQVVYSERVTVDKVKISDNAGPSTDGVDIDSSRYVLVQNCDIDNNDDDICLKAGRDSDGLRVNRPTEYVVIRNNVTRRGGGIISFGSETSGGIRHVYADGNRGLGTSNGLRFKSAKTRGGYVADIIIRNTTMENVALPFSFTLNLESELQLRRNSGGRGQCARLLENARHARLAQRARLLRVSQHHHRKRGNHWRATHLHRQRVAGKVSNQPGLAQRQGRWQGGWRGGIRPQLDDGRRDAPHRRRRGAENYRQRKCCGPRHDKTVASGQMA
jgi:polygalacturonase